MPHPATTPGGNSVLLMDDFASVSVDALDKEDRLELLKRVDAHLADHADDAMALLVQAELCLALDNRHRQVGEFVASPPRGVVNDPLFGRLQIRVKDIIQRSLDCGRQYLQDEYGDIQPARSAFNRACELSSYDPVVCLTAGMAYIRNVVSLERLQSRHSRHMFSVLQHIDPSEIARRRGQIDTAERYLTWAVENSADRPRDHERALRQLMMAWVLQRISHPHVPPIPPAVVQAGPVVLGEELGTLALAYLMHAAAQALRYHSLDTFEALAAAIEQIAPNLPGLLLLRAEYAGIAGDEETMLACYEQAQTCAGQEDGYCLTDRPLLLEVLLEAAVSPECHLCGDRHNMLAARCPICTTALEARSLSFDAHLAAAEAAKRSKSERPQKISLPF